MEKDGISYLRDLLRVLHHRTSITLDGEEKSGSVLGSGNVNRRCSTLGLQK